MTRRFSPFASSLLAIALIGCTADNPAGKTTQTQNLKGLSASTVDDLNGAVSQLREAAAISGTGNAVSSTDAYSTLALNTGTASIPSSTLDLDFVDGGSITVFISGEKDFDHHTKTLNVATIAKNADGEILEEATGTHFLTFPASLALPITSRATRTETVKGGSMLRPAGSYTYTSGISILALSLTSSHATASETLTTTLPGGGTFNGSRESDLRVQGALLSSFSQSIKGQRSDGRGFDCQYILTSEDSSTLNASGSNTVTLLNANHVAIALDADIQKAKPGVRPVVKKFNTLTLGLTKPSGEAIVSLKFSPFNVVNQTAIATGSLMDGTGTSLGTIQASVDLSRRRWSCELSLESGKKTLDLSSIFALMDSANR